MVEKKCPICGKLVIRRGRTCSNECAKKLREKTSFLRYGDKHYRNPDKNYETNLKNHDGVYSNSTLEYKVKRRATSLVRYGYTSPALSQLVKEKVKKTCISRYGVENQMKNPKIVAKCEKTKLSRYGDSHYNGDRSKAVELCLPKMDEIVEKSKATTGETS